MAIAFMHNRRPGAAVVVLSGAHLHKYKHSTEVVAPTCTEQGYIDHICECGDSYKTDYTDTLGHDFSEEWLSDGNGHWHVCTRCGEPSEVVAHTYGDQATEIPICTVCGFASHIHKYTDVVTPPTCSKEGYTTHTCDECGYSFIDSYTDKVSHDMMFTTIKAPTCTENGKRYFWCRAGCGLSFSDSIPMTGHTVEIIVSAVEPTCTNSGNTAVKQCSACGMLLSQYKAIPALGHDFSEDRYCCSRCGASSVSTKEDI